MSRRDDYLNIWVVYNSPIDYPGLYVARLFHNDVPSNTVLTGFKIDEVRSKLLGSGIYNKCDLIRFEKNESDDQHIVETWL